MNSYIYLSNTVVLYIDIFLFLSKIMFYNSWLVFNFVLFKFIFFIESVVEFSQMYMYIIILLYLLKIIKHKLLYISYLWILFFKFIIYILLQTGGTNLFEFYLYICIVFIQKYFSITHVVLNLIIYYYSKLQYRLVKVCMVSIN